MSTSLSLHSIQLNSLVIYIFFMILLVLNSSRLAFSIQIEKTIKFIYTYNQGILINKQLLIVNQSKPIYLMRLEMTFTLSKINKTNTTINNKYSNNRSTVNLVKVLTQRIKDFISINKTGKRTRQQELTNKVSVHLGKFMYKLVYSWGEQGVLSIEIRFIMV